VEVRILGPLEVVEEGAVVEVAPKERVVLARVAAGRGRVVSDEALMDALWGDELPLSARKGLNGYVYRLRKLLGDAVIVRVSGGYALGGGIALDLAGVEAVAADGRLAVAEGRLADAAARFEEALSAFRGEPLAELADDDAARVMRREASELQSALTEEAAGVDVELGRFGQAVTVLERVVIADPTRERAWAQLAYALAASGRQADALDALARAKRALALELGIEPGVRLREVECAILEQSIGAPSAPIPAKDEGSILNRPTTERPAGGPSMQTVLSRDGRVAPTNAAPSRAETTGASGVARFPTLLESGSASPFQGRGLELSRLRELWGASAAGTCQATLISGEPGAGKTRLAAELARAVYAEGATVLYGGCDEALAVPFQPFADACAWYCDNTPTPRLGAFADDLARLTDRVVDRLGHEPSPLRADPASEQRRLFSAVASWLADAAGDGPLLVVLDDLQWASRESVLLLRDVVRTATGAALLLVGIYRDTDLDEGQPLGAVMPDLLRLPTVERLALGGLDRGDVVALVRSAATELSEADADTMGSSIHAETAGNALYVSEVVRDLGESRLDSDPVDLTFGDGVREVIGQRLARFGREARSVLQTAAVAGGVFAIGTVALAGGIGEENLLELLERTCRARLTDEIGAEQFRFAHALVRSTLLTEVSATRQRRIHRAIAVHLEEAQPDALNDLAFHWCAGAGPGDVSKVVHYSERAATAAMDRRAYEDAAQIAQRALGVVDADSPKALPLLIVRGWAENALGDPARYQPTFRAAAELAERAGEPDLHAEAVLGYIGEIVVELDDFARDGLERTLRRRHPTSSGQLNWRLLGTLAAGLANWEPRRADTLSQQALELARQGDDPVAFIGAARARLRCWWDPLQIPARLALVAEMRAAAEEAGLAEAVAQSWHSECALRLEAADMAGLTFALDRLAEINQQLQLRIFRWGFTARSAAKALSTGALDDAERLINEASSLETHGFSLFISQYALLAYLRGGLADIFGVIPTGPRGSSNVSAPADKAFVALAAAEAGRTAEAHQVLEELTDTTLRQPIPDQGRTVAIAVAGRAARALGPGPWIQPIIDQCQPLRGTFATINPGAASLGAIDGILGAVHLAAGDHDEAIAVLTAAVHQNDAAGLHPYTAIALADLAEAHLAVGDTLAAERCATRAERLASTIGMAGVLKTLDELQKRGLREPSFQSAVKAVSDGDVDVPDRVLRPRSREAVNPRRRK
jgi:DNA-binding SARP family transcriptional activator